MTRNGKIARLPHKIREELNSRLYDGETAKDLLPWLNSLPEVQPIPETLSASSSDTLSKEAAVQRFPDSTPAQLN